MRQAGLDRGAPPPDSTAAAPLHEPACRPSIERVAGVRILRGGAGWHGVSLRVGSPEDSSTIFDLSLVTQAGHSIRIARLDEDEVVAAWRALARHTGLPMLVEKADGTLACPYPQIGRLSVGPVRLRRAHGGLRHRRPRFLTRRKPARLADLPVVHGMVTVPDTRDLP